MAYLDHLISFWPGNEDIEIDDTLPDAYGSHDGGQVNTPGSDTGLVYPTARLCVEDDNEYFIIDDSADFEPGAGPFGIALWVYLNSVTSGTTMGICGKDPDGSTANREYDIEYWTDGHIYASLGSGSYAELDGGAVATGGWVFVVIWKDTSANTFNLQINNGTPVSASHSAAIAATSSDLLIGNAFAALYQSLDGRIGPVMFFKGGFPDADERTYLYNGGAGRTLAAMLGSGGSQNPYRRPQIVLPILAQ